MCDLASPYWDPCANMTSNLGVLIMVSDRGFDDLGKMVQRHWLVEHVCMNKVTVRDLARMFLSKSHGKLGSLTELKVFWGG